MAIQLKPISQQTIVITGASSGIGLCTARTAAGRGAKVILISRNEGALEKVVAELKAEGKDAACYVADVGDQARIPEVRPADRRAARRLRYLGEQRWRRHLCATRGNLRGGRPEDLRNELLGVVHGALEALKHLKKNGGAIINTGSIASDMLTPILSAYAASKSLVRGFLLRRLSERLR